VFRRRRLPPALIAPAIAFDALIPALERAKAALLTSVPGTRLPGRPLAETLLAFEEELRVVRSAMDAWRAPELEDVWAAARGALEEALSLAERVRVDAPDLAGFEGLIGLVGSLLAPLDAFAAAAERIRDLRR
jgi:hypothetical protein